MTDEEILIITKSDLELSNGMRDAYISQLITTAKEAITEEGITLDTNSAKDCMLIGMYAAYLYRARAAGNNNGVDATKMPRMLRFMLNNRLFAEKMGGESE